MSDLKRRFCCMALAVFFVLGSILPAKPVEAASKWKVTQYGGVEDKPQMFYTITDSKNRLIIIDGGLWTNAKKVRSVISKHGNRVYAWIITHPHPDHVGAFNTIMSKYESIKVNRVYTINVNQKRYKATAKDYDKYSAYVKFKKVIKKRNLKVTYVHENSTYKILGLKMKVLSAWDSYVDTKKADLCNYGSMMFRISGNKRSMLFCADVTKVMQSRIIKRHKKELRATYVQCGHHGNNGLLSTFYDYVKPKGAFFDSPTWVINDTTGRFDAAALMAYFRGKNVKIYSMLDGPHTVTIT